MNREEAFKKLVALMRELSEAWDYQDWNEELEYYPKELPSFDELTEMIAEIKFKVKE